VSADPVRHRLLLTNKNAPAVTGAFLMQAVRRSAALFLPPMNASLRVSENVLMTHAARISDMARLGLGVSGPPDVPR